MYQNNKKSDIDTPIPKWQIVQFTVISIQKRFWHRQTCHINIPFLLTNIRIFNEYNEFRRFCKSPRGI